MDTWSDLLTTDFAVREVVISGTFENVWFFGEQKKLSGKLR